MTPLTAIFLAWTAWFVSWMVAAFWANRTVARAASRGLPSRIGVALGAGLIGYGAGRAMGLMGAAGWAMFALALSGFAFAWWARIHLGPLWSAETVRKEGHRVVDSGPYGIVRHPIYTGVILAASATAIAEARWQAVAGAVVFAVSFGLRARREENFLRQELGQETYDSYARRVPMLIPLWPRTR